MTLTRHFQQYRELVSLDAFPNYVEYSKRLQTADPSRFPTVFDYLVYIRKITQSHADCGNTIPYFESIANHQEAFLSLFSKMYEEETKDGDPLAPVSKYGWRFFKYSSFIIQLDKLTIIPIYHKKYLEYIESGMPCFSGDEMKVAMDNAPLADKILDEKRKGLFYLNTVQGEIAFTPLYERNSGAVRDWTGRLSYEK